MLIPKVFFYTKAMTIKANNPRIIPFIVIVKNTNQIGLFVKNFMLNMNPLKQNIKDIIITEKEKVKIYDK